MDHAPLRAALKAEPHPTSQLLLLLEEALRAPSLLADPGWDELVALVWRNGTIAGDFRADDSPARLAAILRGACQALAPEGPEAAEALWRLLLRGLAAPPRPLRPST